MRYMLINAIFSILPPTRFFEFKRLLLGWLGVMIGEGTKVCGAVKFYGGGKVIIGNNCWIGIGSKFFTSHDANIVIGNRCDIAPEVLFHCGSHEIGDVERRAGSGKSIGIHIHDGNWIGVRSVVLGGCELGAGSIVGANSLLIGQKYQGSKLIVGSPGRSTRDL